MNKAGDSAEKNFNENLKQYHAIFFDGKKDRTYHNNEGRSYFEEEDQYAILGYPANDYLGYVVPDTGEGKEVGKSVHRYLDNINFNFDALLSVGGDGCSTNTGPWGGAFHEIEKVKLD